MSIQLQFLGATQNVTGSSHLLEIDKHRILVDCGLYQEREFRVRNWNPFPVNPQTIDTVLLTHAHLDHCGLLPKLVKEGFKGKILCTPPTQQITRILLFDSAHIQEEDAEFKKRRHIREGRKGPYPEVPLYTENEVKKVIPLFEPVEYENPVNISKSVRVSFHDAGHILGSSMIKIKINSDDIKRTIIFSGDIGRWNKPIIRDPTVFEEADYVIMESTYGNRFHENIATTTEMLKEVVKVTEKKGGNLIIPSFALERTQELLYYLSEFLSKNQIPHLLTFVDSPMAIDITEVFNHYPEYFDKEMLDRIQHRDIPFYWTTLKLTRSVGESKAINHIKASCIIIAGSGMCTGGRIKHHLVNNISRPESTILFVGYQAKGTLGREIIEGSKKVRILGQTYPVKARIVKINGFSAHADQNELLKWLSSFKSSLRHLFVVHGEQEVALKFARLVRINNGWNVSVPQYLEKVALV